jgi:hypothetical protein
LHELHEGLLQLVNLTGCLDVCFFERNQAGARGPFGLLSVGAGQCWVALL